MHIKQVLIEGFKSYREQVGTEPFSSKVNCVVGANGSGKSNFFHAIRFVLSDLFQNLRNEDRHAPLHEGAGHQVMSAYVEVVFDNSDNRIPVEEVRTKVSETSTKMYNSMLDAHEKAKDLEETFKNLTKEVQNLSKEKEAIEAQQTEAIKKHTELELDMKDLQEKISGNIQTKDDAIKQIHILQREIQESTEELDKINPFYEAQAIKEKEITKGIMDREKQLSVLYQKQGRATQFSSKAARDKWLQKEIDDLERVLSSNMLQEQKLQDEINRLNADMEERNAYIKSHISEIEILESLISPSCEGFNIYEAERDKLQDERKTLWGKESELSAQIDKLKIEVEKAKKNLDNATPGDVRRGLNSIRRICAEFKIDGVFGPVIELLDCDENFFTAVEVTAGDSLFHVVVENDEISTQIIRHLNSLKGGRVTFIPLNQVKAPHVNYPKSSDVIPLLKKLKFNPKFTPAFGQVFARTVVCRDLDVATRVARTDGLDCITLEGDQVSKKGGMTGGFYDHRHSKLRFMNAIMQNTKLIDTNEEELERVRSTLHRLDQKITELVAEQQKLEAKRAHDKSQIEQHKQDIANADKQKQLLSKALANKEKSLADVHSQIDQLRASMGMKQAEMGTELIDHLTPEEKDLLSRLNPEIKDFKEQLIACRTDRIETETRKAELETNLSTNLKRQKQELEAIISSLEADSFASEVELKRQELEDAKSLVDYATQQLKRITGGINERKKLLKKIKDDKIKLKNLEDDYEKTLQDEAKELEQLFSKRNSLVAKQEEYSKKIRELGPLSSDAFETYKRKNVKELQKMLHRCNEQLQQFSHVNKKALDQCVNFTDQRDELQKRQAELDAGDEDLHFQKLK